MKKITKEEKIERKKIYRAKNKEKIKEYTTKYKLKNKERDKVVNRLYHKTIAGVFTRVYAHQKETSKRRGHCMPDYTKQDLVDRFLRSDKFLTLFFTWEESGYKTQLKPSFDRIDAGKPYTLNNLQLMTWGENKIKGKQEKFKRPVDQYGLAGFYIKSYKSIRDASNITGADRTGISLCCKGRQKTSGGFNWVFKD